MTKIKILGYFLVGTSSAALLFGFGALLYVLGQLAVTAWALASIAVMAFIIFGIKKGVDLIRE